MRTPSSTLYTVRPFQHWDDWKRGNGKRETVEKWHLKTRNRHAYNRSKRLTKTCDTYFHSQTTIDDDVCDNVEDKYGIQYNQLQLLRTVMSRLG